MRVLLLFVLIIAMSCGTKTTYSLMNGKSCQKVEIINSGELYATYDLGRSIGEQKLLLKQGISETVLDNIIKLSVETSWPLAISQLGEREKLRGEMNKYQAYLVGELSDKYLLIIPRNKNLKMPKYLIPEQDIYMIIGKRGVNLNIKK